MTTSAKHTMHGWGAIAGMLVLLVAAASGCAVNSEMTNLWHDPTLAPGSIHNVLVVAIRKDGVRRRMWEDAYVSGLGARGVAATASYREFAGAPPDTQQVIESVERHHYDAVLVSARLPNETTSHYVPGELRREPIVSQGYYGRFHNTWVTVQEPGYNETDTVIQVQTEIWATGGADGHIVWSGTLRTYESVTHRTAERAVTRDILPALDREGVLPHAAK